METSHDERPPAHDGERPPVPKPHGSDDTRSPVNNDVQLTGNENERPPAQDDEQPPARDDDPDRATAQDSEGPTTTIGAFICEPSVSVVVEAGTATESEAGSDFAFVPPNRGGTRLATDPVEEVSSTSGNHDSDGRVLNDRPDGVSGSGERSGDGTPLSELVDYGTDSPRSIDDMEENDMPPASGESLCPGNEAVLETTRDQEQRQTAVHETSSEKARPIDHAKTTAPGKSPSTSSGDDQSPSGVKHIDSVPKGPPRQSDDPVCPVCNEPGGLGSKCARCQVPMHHFCATSVCRSLKLKDMEEFPNDVSYCSGPCFRGSDSTPQGEQIEVTPIAPPELRVQHVTPSVSSPEDVNKGAQNVTRVLKPSASTIRAPLRRVGTARTRQLALARHAPQVKKSTKPKDELLQRLQLKLINKNKADNNAVQNEWTRTGKWVKKITPLLSPSQLARLDLVAMNKILSLPSYSVVAIEGGNDRWTIHLSELRFFCENEWITDRQIEYVLRFIQSTSVLAFEIVDTPMIQMVQSGNAESIQELVSTVHRARACGLLVTVVNQGGYHWVCAILDFKRKTQHIYDPLNDPDGYDDIQSFLGKIYGPVFGTEWIQITDNVFGEVEQQDGYNCGLFVIQFVDYYVNNKLDQFRTEDNREDEWKRTQICRLTYMDMLTRRCTLYNQAEQSNVVDLVESHASLSPSDATTQSHNPTQSDSTNNPTVAQSDNVHQTQDPTCVTQSVSDAQSDSAPGDRTKHAAKQRRRGSRKNKKMNKNTHRSGESDLAGTESGPKPSDGTDQPRETKSGPNRSEGSAQPPDHSQPLTQSNAPPQTLDHSPAGSPIKPKTQAKRLVLESSADEEMESEEVAKPSKSAIRRERKKRKKGDSEDSNEPSRKRAKTSELVQSNKTSSSPQQSPPRSPEVCDSIQTQSGATSNGSGTQSGATSNGSGTGHLTVNSVVPIPILPGASRMSLVSMRNEMIAFARLHGPKSVSLPILAQYFSNHLDESRFVNLENMFNELDMTGEDDVSTREGDHGGHGSGDDTDVDHTDLDRRQLRESLMQLLSTEPGLSLSEIHKRLKPIVTERTDLDALIDEIGEDRNGKYFLKPKATRHATSAPPSPSRTDDSQSSKWIPRKRLKTVPPMEIPASTGIVEEIIDVRIDQGVEQYKVRWGQLDGQQKRDPSSWITRKNFGKYGVTKEIEEQIEMLKRWKKSGVRAKSQYLRRYPKEKAIYNKRRLVTADDDGLCSFRAAGIAIDMVRGRTLLPGQDLVTDALIDEFRKSGLRRLVDKTTKLGTTWKEVASFMELVCTKNHISLDFAALSKNWYKGEGGAGLRGLQELNLPPGIYMMAGFYPQRTAGHCVVLDISKDKVDVVESDDEGGVSKLDWLHELTYVHRVQMLEDTPRDSVSENNDKWECFQAVRVAFDMLTKESNVVTSRDVEIFQRVEAKRDGRNWKCVRRFIQEVCDKKKIALNFDILSKNLSQNLKGVGLDILKKMDLSPDLYLVAGYFPSRIGARCVVIQVTEQHELRVHYGDQEAHGWDTLGWLNELMYVRRLTLHSQKVTRDDWGVLGAVQVAFRKLTRLSASAASRADEVLKPGKHRSSGKWKYSSTLVREICRQNNINLDFDTLNRNLKEDVSGVDIQAIRSLRLVPGLYLMAGFKSDRIFGRCVVVEVTANLSRVYDGKNVYNFEFFNMIEAVTYVRRFKLLDKEETIDIH